MRFVYLLTAMYARSLTTLVERSFGIRLRRITTRNFLRALILSKQMLYRCLPTEISYDFFFTTLFINLLDHHNNVNLLYITRTILCSYNEFESKCIDYNYVEINFNWSILSIYLCNVFNFLFLSQKYINLTYLRIVYLEKKINYASQKLKWNQKVLYLKSCHF